VIQVLDFEFNAENVCGRVIMRPEGLRDTLADIDATSSTIRIDITEKTIVFATEGEQGRVKVRGLVESAIGPILRGYRICLLLISDHFVIEDHSKRGWGIRKGENGRNAM
jgi:hypothetical protein